MAGIILDGKAETERVLELVRAGVEKLAAAGGKPCLAAIQANADAGSDWYAGAQARHCEKNGVEFRRVKLAPDATEAEVGAAVRAASADPGVSGIIILTPLPPRVDYFKITQAIDPAKDAEGVNPENMGRLLIASRAEPAPPTALATMELIKTARPDLSGARALIIGRSATVGKPLALMLLAENATVTIAHTRSELRPILLDAEIVIAAAGASGARWRAYEKRWNAWRGGMGDKPEEISLDPLVTMDMVRRGAIVVDVGDNNIPVGLDGEGGAVVDDSGDPQMRYAGDVDYEKVRDVAGFITKPRGSVGPLTNAFLLLNVVNAAVAGLLRDR